MKKFMLICAPVSSRSGYGAHARDLVWSFIEHDKYDIKIQDVAWGDCPRNALDKNNTEDKKILDCFLTNPQLDRQPDIYVDIRIPNEFQTWGKFNIGITAGVETTAVSGKWLECCNKMDLVIVPSEHSKNGFVSSVYDKMQSLPDGSQQKVGELKLEKPMEVLFEGANEDIYKPLTKKEIKSSKVCNDINKLVKEDRAFLFLGQWTKGGFGEDRKDISNLIKLFYEAFANVDDAPALIMKTNGATYSVLDNEDCLKKIKKIKSMFPKDWKLPNVYLLHGSLSDDEVNELYNHPKLISMVSLTHGEGFGRPLLEATMAGLHVMASGWSGQLDFLHKDKSLLLPGEMKQIPRSVVWKDILIPESQWFVVSDSHVHNAFKILNEQHINFRNKGKELTKENRDKFTLSKMTEKLDEIMKNYLKDTPQQVSLNLPKLKKVDMSEQPTNKKSVDKELSELPSLKLPKLKSTSKNEVSV